MEPRCRPSPNGTAPTDETAGAQRGCSPNQWRELEAGGKVEEQQKLQRHTMCKPLPFFPTVRFDTCAVP